MALNAYLRIKSQELGEIKGSVTQKGREGMILIIGARHSIEAPRDAASGLPTGVRVHEPFVITKELDRSTPLLYELLVKQDNISEWELQFWQPDLTGEETNHYTVKLTNATITSIDFRMPDRQDPNLANTTEYEEVTFTYQKIQWVWNDGSITASDEWAAE